MTLDELIKALSDPRAYPNHPASVSVKQTHISVVFLADEFVYKIKKPVNLGFLDFSTLDLRHHYCREEVRLNRRLAPQVYLDVVPISKSAFGVQVGGSSEHIEWAVKMRRLRDEYSLLHRVQTEELDRPLLARIARRLAQFYQTDPPPQAAAMGRWEVVAQNARDNFLQSAHHVGQTVSRPVFDRVRQATEQQLFQHRSLVEQRANSGKIRDTHGDLRLDHIYILPNEAEPDDIAIIDCIEFSDQFRFADPIADAAFLVMDLKYRGKPDWAQAFIDPLLAELNEEQGSALLPFYTAYRSVVRAKVNGIKAMEPEISDADRELAVTSAKAHWLRALAELEPASRRPVLILVGGLPGTGKSTRAREWATHIHAEVLRSDVVRKEHMNPESDPRSTSRDLYSDSAKADVYTELRSRAEALLLEGNRVIVDATFSLVDWRKPFFDLGRQLSVPVLFFVCSADREIVRQRISERRNDASDADWNVYVRMESQWEEPNQAEAEFTISVDTSQGTTWEMIRPILIKHQVAE
jgi:hypothetical protein